MSLIFFKSLVIVTLISWRSYIYGDLKLSIKISISVQFWRVGYNSKCRLILSLPLLVLREDTIVLFGSNLFNIKRYPDVSRHFRFFTITRLKIFLFYLKIHSSLVVVEGMDPLP